MLYTPVAVLYLGSWRLQKADNVSTYDPGVYLFSTIGVSEINLRERVRLHRVIHSKAFDEDRGRE